MDRTPRLAALALLIPVVCTACTWHKPCLQGVVVDFQGRPVSGAEVHLMPSRASEIISLLNHMPSKESQKVETDTKGTFVLYPQVRSFSELFITHRGYQPTCRSGVIVPATGSLSLGTIRLEPGYVVQGHVRSAVTGAPVAGARVCVPKTGWPPHQSAPCEEYGIACITDTNGFYRLDTLGPSHDSDGHVRAWAEGYSIQSRAFTRAGKGTKPPAVDFSLGPGTSITGVVTDSLGKPLPGASVSASNQDSECWAYVKVETNVMGRFQIPGLPPGTYTLLAHSWGYTLEDIREIPTGKAEVAITLQAQQAIDVQVFDPYGIPLSEYSLELRNAYSDNRLSSSTEIPIQSFKDRPDGRSRFRGVDTGRKYVLRVRVDGQAITDSAPFMVNEGVPTPKVTVRMNAGCSLIGLLVDSYGRPVAGAKIRVRTPLPTPPFCKPFLPTSGIRVEKRTHTKVNGGFTLSALTPETYSLSITHPNYPPIWRDDLMITNSPSLSLGRIAFPFGVIVSGVAYDEAGDPLSGSAVALVGTDQGNTTHLETKTDTQGCFRFTPSPPGSYKVSCGRRSKANPFQIILDMRRSEVALTLTTTNKHHQIRLQLRENR